MSESMHVVCPHCDGVNRVPAAKLGDAPRCGRCRGSLFEGRPLSLDAARFERHVQRGELPLLVDFWAAWCAPCRMMAPAFEAAAARLEPRLRLAKVDTEAEPALGARFGVRSIPTLLLLAGGREVARQAGVLSTEDILRWVGAELQAA